MTDTLTKVAPLSAELAATLDRDGYLLLRGAVPEAWREALRDAFDAGAEAQWPVPRGPGWRHALVDLDPVVQQACHVPELLAATAQLVGRPFYFSQVEGREPRPGAGHQPLHRDGMGENSVAALIFLDPYGPDNGATRVIPRHLDSGEPDETLALTIAGEAGDILVFDADLLHGAGLNHAGTRRRSLLLGFRPETDRAADETTRALRGVRMDTTQVFAL